MLVINYKGKTPQQRKYPISVIHNSKADVIRFILDIQQEDLELDSLVAYVKIKNPANEYYDKIPVDYTVDNDNQVVIDWEMTRKSTQCRDLQVQLQFQNEENVVWQTLIVDLELGETIDFDSSEQAEIDPSVVERLEGQILHEKHEREQADEEINKELNKRVKNLGVLTGDETYAELVNLVGYTSIFAFTYDGNPFLAYLETARSGMTNIYRFKVWNERQRNGTFDIMRLTTPITTLYDMFGEMNWQNYVVSVSGNEILADLFDQFGDSNLFNWNNQVCWFQYGYLWIWSAQMLSKIEYESNASLSLMDASDDTQWVFTYAKMGEDNYGTFKVDAIKGTQGTSDRIEFGNAGLQFTSNQGTFDIDISFFRDIQPFDDMSNSLGSSINQWQRVYYRDWCFNNRTINFVDAETAINDNKHKIAHFYLLSTTDTLASVKADIANNGAKVFNSRTWEEITQEVLDGEYDYWFEGGHRLANPLFNSQVENLDTSPNYQQTGYFTNTFILRVKYEGGFVNEGTDYLFIQYDSEHEDLNAIFPIGTLIYVLDSNLPDRKLIGGANWTFQKVKSGNTFEDIYTTGKIYGSTVESSTGEIVFRTGNATRFVIRNAEIAIRLPIMAENGYTGIDVGKSSNPFRDGYFSGQVYAQNTFNIINASDIVNNTLTQDQYDLITNGKPTLIKGILLSGYQDLFVFVGRVINDNYTAVIQAHTAYTFLIETTIRINATTLVISISNTNTRRLDNIGNINGKALPNYPANTGNFALKQINGTLVWTQEWYGTQAEYDALGTYDSNTIYNIIEE